MKTLKFTANHHAILFGIIAKELMNKNQIEGKLIIQEPIQQYGYERGHRMATRAKADNRNLSVISYCS